MEEMPSGIKRRNSSVLELLVIFPLLRVRSSRGKYTAAVDGDKKAKNIHRSEPPEPQEHLLHFTKNHSSAPLSIIRPLSPALICCDIIKICIANIMKSDATNQIRYTKSLLQCIRKQTIKHFFSTKQPGNFRHRHKGRKNNRKQKSLLFDGRNNCAKKGSSIYALCNNHNEGII